MFIFLAWYVVAAMIMTTLSLILTIAILNIYHHDPSKPVPAWLDRFVLRLLARVLCMHTSDENGNQWVQVAKVVDRFSLIVSFFAVFLTTATMIPIINIGEQ